MLDHGTWKGHAVESGQGCFTLPTEATNGVEVRLFLTPALLDAVEDGIFAQILTATRFPGVRLVVITPDVHHGYGVPVGCAILTDARDGALALGPVGFDIGCGMASLRSQVPAQRATAKRRLEFNRCVMERVAMGVGGRGVSRLARLDQREFERIVRGGADYYQSRYGARLDRSVAERHRIPVDDDWQIPWGGRGRPERGVAQLGSLGGGNHFIELQRGEQTQTLFVQVHTGSRGFGHGLADNYFALAKQELGSAIRHVDEAYFTVDSPHYDDYRNAVAAGGNFAIVNRLILAEEVAAAFAEVFGDELHMVYEISHNRVQREWHPDFGEVNVHRKGATRAFPAGHPGLEGTVWAATGHPVLIPGSNRDHSFILRPLPGAVRSAYSLNHGAGRRMSRGEARRRLQQSKVDEDYRRAGIVVNADGRVPIDEAGSAYKSSAQVVDAIVRAGLAEVEHRLSPLASLKGL
jgi:tRNA-splicing ligase RtcB (3'-phosphate/5'-hydroxy nucleic acid ligase)